ncbi:Uncharacterised protein [Vibrio cholerae]|nr:Uncharacterised protein [Vibrio cholerae]
MQSDKDKLAISTYLLFIATSTSKTLNINKMTARINTDSTKLSINDAHSLSQKVA